MRRYACDAADPAAIELLFGNVVKDLGTPTLVVHNIDAIAYSNSLHGLVDQTLPDGSPKQISAVPNLGQAWLS